MFESKNCLHGYENFSLSDSLRLLVKLLFVVTRAISRLKTGSYTGLLRTEANIHSKRVLLEGGNLTSCKAGKIPRNNKLRDSNDVDFSPLAFFNIRVIYPCVLFLISSASRRRKGDVSPSKHSQDRLRVHRLLCLAIHGHRS